MTKDIRSLEQRLADNLPWNKARIKFLARFLLALYAVRTVNLSVLATAFAGPAKEESNYKRLQRTPSATSSYLRRNSLNSSSSYWASRGLTRWPWIVPTGKSARSRSTF